MKTGKHFDVIIIGGSYSGLAAGMALGRALRKVLIIDGAMPCNRQTPYSHNFITHDGKTPAKIAALARKQVKKYDTIHFMKGLVCKGTKTGKTFEVETDRGKTFSAQKIIFATGIKDILPAIGGFAECWGISVLHCPYCHGYEVRNEKTGILANGQYGFEFAALISNWTKDLILFTNGKSSLTAEQTAKLENHAIKIVEAGIDRLDHHGGYLKKVILSDGTSIAVKALYTHNPFEQHCTIPHDLGCEFTDEGYIRVDPFQKTSVEGIFACGDNTTRMRTVANAVATGTAAGMMANKEIIVENF